MKQQLVCRYDDFSVNFSLNRIIKTTAEMLLHFDSVSKSIKKDLKKLMLYFREVDVLDYHTINWNIQYNKSNQTYRMLISVCYLVIKGLLQTNSDGTIKLMDFFDEQRMCRLYEKFILEFYRKEVPEISADDSEIKWQQDDGKCALLPAMKSDIMLKHGEKTLIIDAKYYSRTTQEQFGKHTLHSGNIYQMFAYVKNQDVGNTGNVAGLLLYAKTDEEITPDMETIISGNRISAKTLDLNCDFSEIEKQLKSISSNYFEI